MSSRRLLNLSIVLGTVTTAAFLLLSNEIAAALINVFSGMAGMIAFVATLTLAADYCPKGAEGFAFAALMSLLNLSSALSSNIGSFLYERAFHNRLAPLILVSAASTAVIFVLVPLLRLGGKQPGDPAGALTLAARPGERGMRAVTVARAATINPPPAPTRASIRRSGRSGDRASRRGPSRRRPGGVGR